MAILKNYIANKKQDYYIVKQILKIISVEPKISIHIDNNARNIMLAVACILVDSQDNPDQ